VQGYQFLDLPTRKLRAKTLEKFGIRVAVSEEDGVTPQAAYQPYYKNGKLCAYKVKTIGLGEHNKTYWLGDGKDVDLFNWQEAKGSGAYRLIITEGEMDSAAVDRIYEMYGNEEYKPAIVSLQYGAGRARESLQKHAEEIKRLFKEVVLVFDDDEPGRNAVNSAMLTLPNAKTVTLPEKDANDCLIAGKAKAAYKTLAYHLAKPKNTRLVYAEDIHEAAREAAKYGELTWPFPKLNAKTRGIRYGETVYIGAGVKMGKSELLNELAAHFIEEHGVKVFMAKPEESNKKTYKLLAGKLARKAFHDPDKEFDYEAYDKAGKLLQDKLVMVNLYQHLGWDSLKEDIQAAAAWGAKVVFIDPITNLTNGQDSAAANTHLAGISQELSAMALDLELVIFIFCHLKAPEGNLSKDQRTNKYAQQKYTSLGNCPHELGGDVLSAQFAGSRAMMRSCNYMIGLEGNKDDSLPEEVRNTRVIRLLEDREFGEVASIPLYWNRNTTRFVEL
jgi:twinkle protein